MRKVGVLVAAVVIVLGVAVFAFLNAVDASGKPASTHVAATVKVPTSTKTYSMTVAGVERSYEVIEPTGGLPKSAPIIVTLSGLGASVASEVSRDQMLPYATADEAELVYPVAIQTSWNAIGCCGYASSHNVDDLAFIKALVAQVDPGKQRSIYVLGFSNGARLAYRIACTDPGLFDAYAMVKGAPLPGCTVTAPLTLIELASVDDPEIPYQPGDKGLPDEALPITTLMAQLHATEKCPASSVVTQDEDMTLTSWSGCADGTRLAFAVWPTGAHLFPRPPVTKLGASPVIWSFLTRTPLAPLP
jgi:polyhydroxybutyrate depolymerase